MNELWKARVVLAAAVDRADRAIEAAKKQAENKWGLCWDELHDMDDQIIATNAFNAADIAIKARVRLLRGNENFPYLYSTQSIARDAIGTSGARRRLEAINF
jgi:hypothetical protein